MIDTNNSSQDYFLIFKTLLVIASMFCLFPYGQESFYQACFFFFLLLKKKKKQSRGKFNLVIYVMCWQTVSERGDVLL